MRAELDVAVDRPVAPERSANYFVRHWRGELSLGISYWLNGALLANAVPLLLLGAVRGNEASDSADLRVTALLQLGVIVATCIGFLWSVVGTWRSAGRHVDRGGSAGWAVAAKVMVVLGTLSLAGNMARDNIAQQAIELTQIALGKDPLPLPELQVTPDGKSLHLTGSLGTGSAAAVRDVLAASPQVNVVVLRSNGGRVFEARAIAGEVRRRQLNTYVEGLCASACTLVFLAGHDRGATPNARIGFHRPAFAGREGNGLAGTDQLSQLYRDAGVSEHFVSRVRATPHASMWFPTRHELIDNKVLTRVSLGGEAATIMSDRSIRSEDDIAKILLATPSFRAMNERYPGSVASAAKKAWQSGRDGANDNQLLTSARAVVVEYSSRALAVAPDDLLHEFLELSRSQLTAAQAISAEACTKLIDQQLNVAATLPKDILQHELELVESLFTTPPRNDTQRLTAREAQAALQPAASQLTDRQRKAIDNPDAFAADAPFRCDAVRSYYDAVARLPNAQRRVALRAIYGS